MMNAGHSAMRSGRKRGQSKNQAGRSGETAGPEHSGGYAFGRLN